MSDGLHIWTVYDHPTDMPDNFVVRLSIVDSKGIQITSETLEFKKLADLRAQMRTKGLTMIPRFPDDDPKILEVWL